MLAKTIEFSSLGVCAGLGFLAEATSELPDGFLKGGTLLALLAFMIAQNYRQQRATNHAIEGKDKHVRYLSDQLARLLAENIDAKKDLAEALKDRPCICQDSRIRSRENQNP